MNATHLIVSDIDGTLLGDDEALRKFAAWIAARAASIRLAYASGRFFESVRESINTTPLPMPDAVLGGVGTDIRFCPSGTEFTAWHHQIGVNWDAERVRRALSSVDGVRLQPAEHQSLYKVSFYAEDLGPAELEQIHSRLREVGIDASVIYSSSRDLDILPASANKGTAAAFLARTWNIAHDNVIVCGDSGNDQSMFDQGFRGIVVSNAMDELKQLNGKNVYHAQQPFAAGVLEGLEHFFAAPS